MRQRLLRGCVLLCVMGGAAMAALASSPVAQAQSKEQELEAAKAQLHALFADKKYVVALPVAERIVGLAKAVLGPSDIYVGTAHSNYGVLLQRTGRMEAAAVQLRHALDIFDRLIPPSHARYRSTLRSLVGVNTQLRRLAPAEAAYRQALAALDAAGQSRTPIATNLLNDLGMLYRRFGKLASAEKVLRRALVIKEAILERGDPSIATTLSNLAGAVRASGRYREAEPLYLRAIEMMAKARGPQDANVAILNDNLAVLYLYLGRYGEAEKLNKRSLQVLESRYGLEHVSVGQVVANLAEIYRVQRRHDDAEAMFRRALGIFSKVLPQNDYRIGFTLDNLAGLYREQGRPQKARPLYERAVATLRKSLPAEHPDIAHAMNNLALVLVDLGEFVKAESLFKQSLASARKTYGESHREISVGMANLADVQMRQGRHEEAAKLLRTAIVQLKDTFGKDHPTLIWPLRDLGVSELASGNALAGLQYLREAVAVQVSARRRQSAGARAAERLKVVKHGPFQAFVDAAWTVAKQYPQKTNALAGESLMAAQWASMTRAGHALSQLAARTGAGDATLSALVRERQDLAGEWQALDKRLTALLARASGRRHAGEEEGLRARIVRIEGRLDKIDGQLADSFPDYAALTSPKPMRIADIQGLLRPNEALVQFLVGERASYVWVVRPSDVVWRRVETGRRVLQEQVARLRCGLDASRWYDSRSAKYCREIAGAKTQSGELPFSVAEAHKLYEQFLAPVSESIFGRHLLLVPTGPLTSLPFQVLVSKPVAGPNMDFTKVDWLVRSHPMTTLPSIRSLAALRRHAAGSQAPYPYVGFGNPLLLGLDGGDKSAYQYQDCRAGATMRRAERVGRAIGRRIKTFFRGSVGDLKQVRSLSPLPETAYELCSVAENLRARHADVVLGKRATESLIKDLGRSGRLSKYRVVHFATHGLVAGELSGLAEPALVMTPPKTATRQDDGLLTASEVANLKLDADWIILSACNTAAGDGYGAEPLSGLARAFFYAGSRSLLVSHWPVESQAAIRLTVSAIEELRSNPRIGRAEALRRSMLAMISRAKSSDAAHPKVWAPFVVIGEGGGGGAMRPATAPFPLSSLGGGRSSLGAGTDRGVQGAGQIPDVEPVRRKRRISRRHPPDYYWKQDVFGTTPGGAVFGLD